MPGRPTQTITISLSPELAAAMDRLAKEEQRSRSELLREAFRRYVEGHRRWERVLDLGPKIAAVHGLHDEATMDAAVDQAVHEVRGQRAKAS
jgi:putative PIN family toxin of toxin-antitoxin system